MEGAVDSEGEWLQRSELHRQTLCMALLSWVYPSWTDRARVRMFWQEEEEEMVGKEERRSQPAPNQYSPPPADYDH